MSCFPYCGGGASPSVSVGSIPPCNVYIDKMSTLYNSLGVRLAAGQCNDRTVIRIVGMPLLISLLILTTVDIVAVSGESMEPTIASGERLLVLRSAYGLRLPPGRDYLLIWREPERGDIVLFINPIDGSPVVKRCVGLPGDALIFEEQSVRLEGITYPIEGRELSELRNYTHLPPGHYFLVGDNSTSSRDSRHYGFVSVDRLLGKVLR